MTAQIIAIGDEILIGQTLDTNSQYIAQSLIAIGIEIISIQAIADHKDSIENVLANPKADILLFTGGLGPTKDDITKKTLAQFLGVDLVEDASTLQNIENLLKKLGRTEINDLNRQQALIPKGATALQNRVGTAPGMWVKHIENYFVFMPGIPFEMKYLLKEEIIPKLLEIYPKQNIFRRNVLVFNVPESELALRLENWENQLPNGFSVAYLPTAGIVKMRLSYAFPEEKKAFSILEEQVQMLKSILGEDLINVNGEDLPEIVGGLIKKKNLQIATAESFTAGKIVNLLTSVSGSSAYVKGGIVPYQVSMKEKILHIPKRLIEEHLVVSEEMALEMATQAQHLFDAPIAISTTGVAGPTTDEHHTNVGLAFIGIKIEDKSWVRKLYFPRLEREEFSQLASRKALEYLLKILMEIQ